MTSLPPMLETVVLVHSFPLDHRMWSRQVDSLTAAGFRVLAPDLPGFGSAPLPPSTDASLDVYVDALIALLDRERVARAVFVGLSMGGYVVLRLAARHLDRVRAMVLADTRAGGDAPMVRAARVVNLSLVRSRGSLALVEKLLPTLVSLDAPESLKAQILAMGAAQPAEGVAFALLAMRDRPDATGALGGMRVPALVVVGERDTVTPPDEHRELCKALPDATLIELSKVGHLASLEGPEVFNSAVLGFLARVTGQRWD